MEPRAEGRESRAISIFNQVLGPVMRGPSSSHTAGAYHIASMARGLLGARPTGAVVAFDPAGSYAATYASQGADRAFAVGLLDRPLTDDSFFSVLAEAAGAGLDLRYEVRPLRQPEHPNHVEIRLTGDDGRTLDLEARSIGGGEVELTRVASQPVRFDGASYESVLVTTPDQLDAASALLDSDGGLLGPPARVGENGRVTVCARRARPLGADQRAGLDRIALDGSVRESAPVYFVPAGPTLFSSAREMLALARARGLSLGRLALEYESKLLGLTPGAVIAEMLRRYDVMARSVEEGLRPDFTGTQLVEPAAGPVFRAEQAGRLTMRSAHTRAAARAMAVMHVDGAMGVVCAAPTGGSAGVIPGALVTLAEERGLDREEIALALLAAGLIGVIVARRATFAAEVAGCQVEIGAAGAMASAAVVDAVGGTAEQAAHAASIAFQNTMGLVCDLVQGMVEIPCHTRNAVAAASAFVNADLVLGGYVNPIPLDETIDAVFAVGRMMPRELLCTSEGGLATTPSALALKPGCCGKGCCG